MSQTELLKRLDFINEQLKRITFTKTTPNYLVCEINEIKWLLNQLLKELEKGTGHE